MPHTLLLADNSLAIHRVVELTFAGQPIEVVAVRDGAAAVARLEAEPPDIILADIAMAAPSGYDIAAHVKRTPRLAAIPVVLLTGAFEPVDEARARALGCAGVLSKPFDPEIVVRRVNELLRRDHEPANAPSLDSAEAENAPLPTTSALVERESERAPSLEAGDEQAGYFERLDQSLTARRTPAPPPDFGATFAAAEPPAPSTPMPVEPVVPAGVEAEIARAALQFLEQDGRGVVREIVSQVAERLIREEIARIKADVDDQ